MKHVLLYRNGVKQMLVDIMHCKRLAKFY